MIPVHHGGVVRVRDRDRQHGKVVGAGGGGKIAEIPMPQRTFMPSS